MDTGHVKQVAAFEKLLGFCNAHGAMFNPSKTAIQSTALSALLTSAQQSIEAVRTAHTELSQASDVRNDVFTDVPKFMTRIVNTLASSGASEATLEEAYRYIRKFYRPKKAKPVAPVSAGGVEGSISSRSSSQLDFDSKVSNFEGLVKVVSLEPLYQPNETDLQVISLQAKVAYLRSLNTDVINKQVALSNTRALRNKLLYESSGVHGLAKAVKRYVKGVFGFQSVAYNQIRSLKFSNKKIA
jgi:hypothetical protein